MRFFALPLVLSFAPAALAADEASFVASCTNDPVEAVFDEALCACTYGRLTEVFEEAQVARIGTLFTGSPSAARESLRSDADPNIQAIAERISEVEDALIACLEEAG